ncbi:MAG: Hsp33 family molecular chaperone HslO [Woeseiaceae bacterium]|jgi:molecular chaperone Hsp33|nr:Hsp33 family molecular chaperone HslO [Woeseiaceae bacterium]
MQADHVLPFAFESLPVRGELIQLSRCWRRMLRDHDYAPVIRETLGHAAAATGLIAQSLKFDGAVTMQIQGSGDLRLLVMQCTNKLELRGMATPAPELTATSFDGLMTDAHCAITIDAGERPYQGIVEVDRDSLAASLDNYFTRSVQVPSHVVLTCNDDLAAGMLLQQMPGHPIDEDDWRRLGFLAATLSSDDFSEGVGLDLVRKLFAEDDVRVFDAKPVVFRCRCSRRRAEDVLRMLGPAETREALEEQGTIRIRCEYCGERREFDEVDVSKLFVDNVVKGPESIQ